MRLTYDAVTVHTHRTFRIATESSDAFPTVITCLEHDGVVGYGEGAPAKRVTGEDVETMAFFLDWAAKELATKKVDDWQAFLDHMHHDICGNPTARCAVDLAVHDLVGKLQGVPARRLYDLPDARLETSITVSLDTPEAMAEEAAVYRARGFRAIKLKLGEAAADVARVAAVRDSVPDARLRADANTGWSVRQAERVLPHLARLGVEFLEQPFAKDAIRETAALSRWSPVPIYADESVLDVHDVVRLKEADFRGGVNLKLMKAGGLRPGIEAARAAREAGFQVQLGCMIEGAVGINAAIQMLGILDHADLDGALLLRDHPFHGVDPVEGVLETPAAAGLGVKPR